MIFFVLVFYINLISSFCEKIKLLKINLIVFHFKFTLMKKIVFIFVFIIGLSASGIAQQKSAKVGQDKNKDAKGQPNASGQGKQSSAANKMTPEQKANKLTQYMTTALTLTSTQQTQVAALNTSKAKQVDSIKTATKGNTDAAKNQLKSVKSNYNTSLNNILTAEQKTKWEALKKQKKEESEKNKAAGVAPKEGELTVEDIE